MTNAPGAKIDGSTLTGVSETALMTLHQRAHAARRSKSLIDDPMAIVLDDAIEFDASKFGRVRGQGLAWRAKTFDTATIAYLRTHPRATVVALAEGLQTSFYRVDAAGVGHDFRWVSVDLPPMIEVRSQLLPTPDRVQVCPQSALDFSWMDRVDTTDGVFVTPKGC